MVTKVRKGQNSDKISPFFFKSYSGKLLLNPNKLEIDHGIFSTVILSLPLIQKGQLSVSGERMCTILVNRLED